MYQFGGLNRLAGSFVRQTPGGQLAQLVINQRQEIRRSLFVSLADGLDNLGDVDKQSIVRNEPTSSKTNDSGLSAQGAS